MSFGVWIFVLTFTLSLLVSSVFFNERGIKYMELVKWQFLALEGGTNRLDIGGRTN